MPSFLMEEFTIYAKSGCSFCDKLAALMDDKGIPYTKLMLDEDFDTDRFLVEFGRSTFPRVLHKGELIGGMHETVNYLVKNGLV